MGSDNVMRASEDLSNRHEYNTLTKKEEHLGTQTRYLKIWTDDNVVLLNKDRPLYHKINNEFKNTITKAGADLIAPAIANERYILEVSLNHFFVQPSNYV